MGCEDEKQQEPAGRADELLAKAKAVAEKILREDFDNCITDSSGPKGMQFAEASASCEPTPANRASSSSGSQPADVLPAAVSKASIAHEETKTEAKTTKQEAPCDTSDFLDAPVYARQHAGPAAAWITQDEAEEAWLAAAQLKPEELKAAEAKAKLTRGKAQLAPQKGMRLTGDLSCLQKVAKTEALHAECARKDLQAQLEKQTELAQRKKNRYAMIKRANLETEKEEAAKDQGFFYIMLYNTIP